MKDQRRIWAATSEASEIIKDAKKVIARNELIIPERRRFLVNTLTLGGVGLLSGCDVSSGESVDKALEAMSRINDKIQATLFSGATLAPTYPEEMITRPFPFNAFYSENEVVQVIGEEWRLELAGQIAQKRSWSLAELAALPMMDQITRHICVEGWSAIGRWGGVPFSMFLHRVGADLSAKYVAFKCADDYYTSIDMATALHPQTILALQWDGEALPPKYGFPVKLRIPTKLGYKNPKHIRVIEVTNTYPGGYWEDQGYNWFGGS